MQILCTLFDSNYLSRALACHESLLLQNFNFHIYMFAFDDLALSILKKLKLSHATVISLEEFEDEELLKIKSSRSIAEYCWTCTPSVISYVLSKYGHDYCTYIDADTCFYRNPVDLYTSMGSASVLITPHFYTPTYDQTETSGIYCVQYMTFKNDAAGLLALYWWRHACLDWCYARFEDGKFGDQKYLDDWPERFPGVYVSPNMGEGVAPWNIQQWNNKDLHKVIFYHFHALKLFEGFGYMGFYNFPHWATEELYRPYVKSLRRFDHVLLQFPGYKSCFKKVPIKEKLKLLIFEKLKLRNNLIHF